MTIRANYGIRYEQNGIFEVLVDQDEVFESYLDLMLFAAAFGYSRQAYKDEEDLLPRDDRAETKWAFIMGSNTLEVAIAAMAYSRTGDPEVLTDRAEQIRHLIQYAAGGADILLEEVVEVPGDNLELIIQLVEDVRDEDEMQRQLGILEEIDSELTTFSAGAGDD
jgi:dnd system-associated protein 4